MVDSISSVGQVGSVTATNNKIQKQSDLEKSEDAKIVDEVSVSKEALELAEIEQIAKDVASDIVDDKMATLSGDVEKLSILL